MRLPGSGKPGPKPLPSNVTRFRGTIRPDRERAKPVSPKGKATRPDKLPERARREWDRLAPQLHRLRLLTPADRGAFTLLCLSYGIALDAADALQIEGRVLDVPQGKRRHPDVAAFMQAVQTYTRLAQQFGLTPASRQALQGFLAPPVDPETPASPTGTDGQSKSPVVTDRRGRPI